jgi:rRNA maturation RNase YbeY
VIDIDIINHYGDSISYDETTIKLLINNLIIDQKAQVEKLSIILSDKFFLNKLKKDYFNQDHFTDVIAFNLEEKNNPIDGEVYISIDDVLENSIEYKENFNVEFKRILIHGILHLLGYIDDTIDKKKLMTDQENKYIKLNSKIIINHKR